MITEFTGAKGVSFEVGQKVRQMLVGGRRYFGSAGASLTQHVADPDFNSEFSRRHVQVGLDAERDTSERLREWMRDKPNVVLADSVHIIGAGKETVDPETGIRDGGDTDHVLLIGNEVVLIDTKRWKSRRKYSVSDKGTILRQGRNFGGGRVHANQARHLWRKHLGKEARISALVCINTDKVFVPYDKNWKRQGFRLITVENLYGMLDSRYARMSEENKSMINANFVAQVALSCVPPFDAYDRVFNRESLANFS